MMKLVLSQYNEETNWVCVDKYHEKATLRLDSSLLAEYKFDPDYKQYGNNTPIHTMTTSDTKQQVKKRKSKILDQKPAWTLNNEEVLSTAQHVGYLRYEHHMGPNYSTASPNVVQDKSPTPRTKQPETYMGSITNTLLGAVYLDQYMDTNPVSDELEVPEPTCIRGTLYVTNYQVMFVQEDAEHSWQTSIPMTAISNVEKILTYEQNAEALPMALRSASGYIIIKSKDLQIFRIIFFNESTSNINQVYPVIVSPKEIKDVFAFHFRRNLTGALWSLDNLKAGWIYNPIREFKRQGVDINNHSSSWRLTAVNDRYELCDTYPQTLVVPRSIGDDQLKLVAQFRSKGRIPVLTWKHPTNGAVITRSSQPLVGITRARSREDELLIEEIRRTANGNQPLKIFDCRPRANALGNTLMGKGYENTTYYTNCSLHFLGIDHIHTMTASLASLTKLCQTAGDIYWLQSLESSGWLHHVRAIMIGANRVVDAIQRQQSVLVHCSDGWDRTAQVSALAQLLLDPYYRTIEGFQVLIEKEFISFGHKFTERIGHIPHSTAEVSPVFLQFIDCVYQVFTQFPSYFEFNELFLITILDHLYSCLFGNFLHNCEKERDSVQVKARTVSLWTYMNGSKHRYVNTVYGSHFDQQPRTPFDMHQSDEDISEDESPIPQELRHSVHHENNFKVVLVPDCNIDTIALHFWTGYFTRHSANVKNKYQDLVRTQLNAVQKENKRIWQKYTKESTMRKELEQKNQILQDRLTRQTQTLEETATRMLTYKRIAAQSGFPIIADENNQDGVIVTKILSPEQEEEEEEKGTSVMKDISTNLVVEDYF